MKQPRTLIAGLAVLCMSFFALAQAPTGAPTGATGQCNDGTYSTQASKRGACRGHQGVKQWFAADTVASQKSATTQTNATPTSTGTPTSTSSAPPPQAASAQTTPPKTKSAPVATPAPGGGPGMVWLNSSTHVYHCSGDPYYGKTKSGKYESEADAKAAGARPSHGKPCS
ncbi:DUF3761 domain-containing protein [Acidisarcina polymorpha]|uniref:DUF3761 domain-containing protein n=1 Tax=Acidisarcina polymorpha TaxID=2211140 RepID=UPI000DEF0D9E|nr:DUF3761 domain-containing protein [Acidisarcina polymorpha]